ncbi:TetR/AcrR family transcriptional regulator [Demequina capsici]|uniref:TetR family transcriptional regulator n=1 Tax=Demequina capsici TaxID=3075620 RepID=A0AA96JBK9_9MICO|nr:TetR family transcriptional regulator [Demequina sp. OYTSA14]WNM25831.1 TetR family transcriptional regulator [Demequina sp. OYTSA14]
MARIPLEERRRLLISATLTVIERDGMAGATARRIVQEAQMPLGALHYAFDNVEALLTAAADEVTAAERLVAEQGLVEATRTEGLAGVLAAGLEGYVDLLVAEPGRELAFLELMLHASRARLASPPAPGRYAGAYRMVGELLSQAAQAAGRTWGLPLEELSRHTVSVLDGITTTWLADHDTDAAKATARFHARALAATAAPVDHQEGTSDAH